ncbi:MAG: hypothetical protein ACHQT5_01565 [Candidatus Saccharimonadales bacterium]
MKGVEYAHVSARTSTSPLVNAPPFGVYRAAESDWHANMHDVIDGLQSEGRKVLRHSGFNERAQLWRGKRTLGVTYVERGRMQEDQLEGIDFGKLVRRIGEVSTGGAEVSVPIDRLEWGGYHRTVLAAFLADSHELRQIEDESAEVSAILEDAGLPSIMVKIPDHVSLCRYNLVPGMVNKLQDGNRTSIKRMAARHLVTASIHAVSLSNLIVGEGYNRPFLPEDWTTPEPSFDFQELLVEAQVTGGMHTYGTA